jgi:fluoride exporter
MAWVVAESASSSTRSRCCWLWLFLRGLHGSSDQPTARSRVPDGDQGDDGQAAEDEGVAGVMSTWLAVLVGGALGSAGRHVVNVAAARWFGAPNPFGTAAVNMLGSLVIGILAGAIAAGRLSMSPAVRTLVFVGIIGGFTTFSSYMLDSLTLVEGGAAGRALLNMLGQVALGFALVYLGFRLGAG